jgi:hypothetical protein
MTSFQSCENLAVFDLSFDGATFSNCRENENAFRARFPSSGTRLSLKAPGNELKRERSIPKVRISPSRRKEPEIPPKIVEKTAYQI